MDIYKIVASDSGLMCKFWRCWENRGRHNWQHKYARRVARKKLRRMDEREWRNDTA